MSKHTPGPWRLAVDWGAVVGAGNVSQFIAMPPEMGRGPHGEPSPAERSFWEGNGQLIAAAPDLLEAAKELVDHLSKMENGKWLNNRPGELLKQAITKAGGK